MRTHQIRVLNGGIRSICLLSMLALAVLLTSGCSRPSFINKSLTRMFRNNPSLHGALKKKIGITFFENKTPFPNRAAEQRFLNDFVENLKKSCSNEILLKPGDTAYPNILVALPKTASGGVDTLELAAAGRKLGFNAIVAGALTNIIKKQEERGFWWLEDMHNFLEIHAAVAVYDTLTGAKLLDESFIHELEVDERDLDGTNSSSDLLTATTNAAIQRIADEMGEQVCSEILQQPWQGYITSVRTDKIIFTSGATVGIQSGEVFEVYDSSEIFDGAEAQRFFIPGPKIGEIKVTKVFADSAEAIQISGQNIPEGSYISPK